MDCEKPQHFFIGPATGQWDCKKCHRRGNPLSFIREFHADWLSRTTAKHYAVLAEDRFPITPDTFAACGLAFNSLRNEWMIPSYGDSGITNLFSWRDLYDEQKRSLVKTMVASPTIPSSLYGLHTLKETGPIFVLEGHWDWLVMHSLFWGMGRLDEVNLLAVTGATNYPKSCLPHLHGRDVFLAFDNDEAGIGGTERLLKSMALEGVRPTKLLQINWPVGLPVGYDTRDFIADAPEDHDWSVVYKSFRSLFKPIDMDSRLQTSFRDQLDDLLYEMQGLQKKAAWLCKRLELLKGKQ
jgi:hypothetical protein